MKANQRFELDCPKTGFASFRQAPLASRYDRQLKEIDQSFIFSL